MQNRALAFILLSSLVVIAGCHRTPPDVARTSASERHFSLTLQHSATGWEAECQTGCSWKHVAMQCGDCKVRIDANGIYDANVPITPSEFAFVVEDNNGLSAHAVKGTRWLDLSWGCATAVCRCQLSEQGVFVPA